VLAAQEAGIRKMVAGAPARDAHQAAGAVFRRAGVEKRFGHGFGHGVGLEVHEAPRLGGRGTDILLAGNVATAEPGLYFPGEGGIRVEDMIYVGAEGARRLTTLPRVLDWAVM